MYSIFHNLFITATPPQVFEAITIPEHLNNWWTKKSSGTPTVGEQYNFYFTPDYNWYGVVNLCEPNKRFYIKMTQADEDWSPTSFGFDLVAQKNGIQLRFQHTDWPACNDHFRRSSFCWAILLNGLKNYVEKGEIMPFEERE